jgi:hypothetical protein
VNFWLRYSAVLTDDMGVPSSLVTRVEALELFWKDLWRKGSRRPLQQRETNGRACEHAEVWTEQRQRVAEGEHVTASVQR